jgi:nitrate/nitrite transporter NarK
MLTGAAVAAGIAFINSVGNLGGFIGPTILGWLTQSFGDSSYGLALLGGCMVLAGLVIGATCRDFGLRREASQVAVLSH